jgi:molecular chaperone DnaK (HSP70)
MPQIKERVDKEFNCDAKLTDPDECVAKGAAIYAMNAAYSQAVRDYEEGEVMINRLLSVEIAPQWSMSPVKHMVPT